MDIDYILDILNRHGVQYILIGGVNFLLRHEPIATLDIDLWIEDSDENRGRSHQALLDLDASWGPNEETWRPVREWPPSWLTWQGVFCLDCRHGSIDIFRAVKGLGTWAESRGTAVRGTTGGGIAFVGLSDADMLKCQLALEEGQRKLDRVRALERLMKEKLDS